MGGRGGRGRRAAARLRAGREGDTESASTERPKASARYTPPDDPYPSTYRPYGGVPTAITGATIYDGEGGRIDNGTIVLVDGRIQAVGGADTPIPDGATRIDGTGRWVTPGSSTSTATSATIPAPASKPIPTATRSPARSAPRSGPSTASGRRTPASRAPSPMAA